jgi:hypothetical protein
MILRSLRLLGEKTRGATLTSNENIECLNELNSMLDSWSNERLMIHTLSQTSFALTAGQGSYTIGGGGDFNMTRPTKIVDPCFIRDTDGSDSPLQLINVEAYGRIVDKDADGSYPTYLYYDYGYSATSTATVYFWPEPIAGLSTFINTLQPLLTFSTMSHTLLMPPGYQRAIEYNYAVEASGGFTNVDPSIAMIARQSKAALKSQNLPAPISRLDYGVGGGVGADILTGP